MRAFFLLGVLVIGTGTGYVLPTTSQIGPCCGILESNDLHSCISQQVEKSYEPPHIYDIGIVTFASRQIWNYSSYAAAINFAYSIYNGYQFRYLDGSKSDFETNDPRWNKVKILENAINPLNGWAEKMKYLMWIDADAVFLDFSFSVKNDIVSLHPNAHIFVCAEHAGSSTMMNSGTIVIRNSPWSRWFLGRWWGSQDRRLFSDQEAFDILYNSKEMKNHRKKVVVFPPDAFNSDPPAMSNQRTSNPVLHLMGDSQEVRAQLFSIGFQNICNSMLLNSSWPLQLGITREVIRAKSQESYSAEIERSMPTFKAEAASGGLTLSQSRYMLNSIFRLGHVLKEDGQESRYHRLSVEAFQLLYVNYLNSRSAIAEQVETSRVMNPDWPEMMKVVVEAGHAAIGIGSVAERRQRGAAMIELLSQILSVCHSSQRPAVLHIVSATYSLLGVIEIDGENYVKALEIFEQALAFSEQLVQYSGKQILIAPLEQVASVLSLLGQFEQALKLFDRVIALAENHLGENHPSLVQNFINYGTALFEAGQHESSKKAISRAERLMQSMEVIHDGDRKLIQKMSDIQKKLEAADSYLDPGNK